jgi:hypothetical protein
MSTHGNFNIEVIDNAVIVRGSFGYWNGQTTESFRNLNAAFRRIKELQKFYDQNPEPAPVEPAAE